MLVNVLVSFAYSQYNYLTWRWLRVTLLEFYCVEDTGVRRLLLEGAWIRMQVDGLVACGRRQGHGTSGERGMYAA